MEATELALPRVELHSPGVDTGFVVMRELVASSSEGLGEIVEYCPTIFRLVGGDVFTAGGLRPRKVKRRNSSDIARDPQSKVGAEN